jgi:hydrogenase-1 operon protein HyaF
MARRVMQNFNFLADDGLVDALLMEVADLLQALIAHRRSGAIDLLGLPLSASCLAALEQRLGKGEMTATLVASGTSEIRETNFPGVWWTSHADEAGRIVAMLIEVAEVPDILRASTPDIEHGRRRLLEMTNFSLARRTG